MKTRILIVIVFFGALIASVQAQDLFFKKNLANVKVDQLTDEQILKFKKQFQGGPLQQQQAIKLAKERGLSDMELQRLLARMKQLEDIVGVAEGDLEAPNEYTETFKRQDTAAVTDRSFIRRGDFEDVDVFGSTVFENPQNTFFPNVKMATPVNYILGPDDKIEVVIYGYQEANYDVKVSGEGNINLPFAGVININGLTLEEATRKVRKKLIDNGYASLGNGQSQLKLVVTEIRSIRINVLGAKKPGQYMVPSVATAFHALYLAGGPAAKGTYRNIQVIRKGKLFKVIDLYDYLVGGDLSMDVGLKENDVIYIPTYEIRVSLRGELKRTGVFEVRADETLTDAIRFAGGFSDIAYKNNVYVDRIGATEREVKDVDSAGFGAFVFKTGDQVMVSSIINRFSNRVSITGAIMRPGYFELEKTMSLRKLLIKADGFREDFVEGRGVLFRRNFNQTRRYIHFDPLKVWDNQLDIVLENGDSIVIGGKSDFYETPIIEVFGDVMRPGKIYYGDSMTALDAIFLAGGFKETYSKSRIDIIRRSKSLDRISETITISADRDLIIQASEVLLQPHDAIIVRPNPEIKPNMVVRLDGEVYYPGYYALNSRTDNFGEIIKRAGGLTDYCDLDGIAVIRRNTNYFVDSIAYMNAIEIINRGIDKKEDNEKKILEKKQLTNFRRYDTIAVSVIMKPNGELESDFILQDEDVFRIPAIRSTVEIRGGVKFPVIVNYRANKTVKYYIRSGGGLNSQGRMKRSVVVYANGRTATVRNFIIFNKYPKVKPGSVIFVGDRNLKVKNQKESDPQAKALMASIVASITAQLALIYSVLK